MATSRKSVLAAHRQRLKRRGVARLEVRVRSEDAVLVRRVVDALNDPIRQAETRDLLRRRFGAPAPSDLKALLAAAPLEGIELTRDRTDREVEL
jgi:hypothetical protein